MSRGGRIDTICSYIDSAPSFADVGCDHGFCAEYVLKMGLADRVYISDISRKSLSKAEALLKKYIDSGICVPVCSDGLKEYPEIPSEVLISGLGGEETVRIFSETSIPDKFILQPMKNAEKVRTYLCSAGCSIEYDGLFSACDKFYFLIKGTREGIRSVYGEREISFGRDSFASDVFKDYLDAEIEKCVLRSGGMCSRRGREELGRKRQYLEEMRHACEGNI